MVRLPMARASTSRLLPLACPVHMACTVGAPLSPPFQIFNRGPSSPWTDATDRNAFPDSGGRGQLAETTPYVITHPVLYRTYIPVPQAQH